MPRICLTSIAAAVALSLSAPLTAEARTPCANEEAPPTALNSAQVSDAVFCLTNQVRAHYGLPAFRRDARLDATARLYSTDMSARGFFGHTSPEGLSPSDRGIAQGYTIGVGENIASGYAHAQEVVLAWVASAPHCRNVLSAAVDLGVGTKGGLDPYYTQNFGDYYSRPVNETARGACPHTVDLDALTIAPPAVVTEPVGATPQPREQPTGRGTTATASRP